MPAAVDKTYICNLALSYCLVRKKISDTSEDSTEAEQCDLHYDQALEDCLEDGDFSWAKRRASLALVSTTTLPTGIDQTATVKSAWAYAYRLPPDCLRPLWIDDQLQIRPFDFRIPFTIEVLDDLEVLYTDMPDVVLIYASRVTDTTLFSRKFAKLVAWKLASMIAGPLTGKTTLADRAEKMAILAMDDAIQFDYNRDQENEPPDASWHRARGAGPDKRIG